MTDLRQSAQQALEALEALSAAENIIWVQQRAEIEVEHLREALEQPEQEPVKLNEPVISEWSLREVYFDDDGEPLMHRSPPAAEPEQEPVAWMYDWTTGDGEFIQDWTTSDASSLENTEPNIISNVRPLYNSHRIKWVDLTEAEHTEIAIASGCLGADWVFYGAAVERKLKEKNNE